MLPVTNERESHGVLQMKKLIVSIGCLSAVLVLAMPTYADNRFGDDGRYRDYRGYKERPYDRGRHYQHYEHRKHQYSYRGHWRSWDEWDRYARRHPEMRRYGRYYYDGPHLMFRTCDPGYNTCIFFSIGR